jgi:rRNA biogenesis protein RRP5
MTFRSGDRAPTVSKLQLSDLSVGQKVQGRVKKVEEFGIFIQIDDSKLSGLCHKSEVCTVLEVLVDMLTLVTAGR